MTADDHPLRGLGKAVTLRRTDLGLKRRELAERAHLSYPYISEIENGVKEPSAKALRQIAEALDMTLSELAALIERIEQRPPEAPSLLLDHLEAPPVAAGPVADRAVAQRMAQRRSAARRLALEPDRPAMMADDDLFPPAAMALSMADERPAPSDVDERVRVAVSREIDTWLREVLPAIVRNEVTRQLDALRAERGEEA